jgi:hypothetical protein
LRNSHYSVGVSFVLYGYNFYRVERDYAYSEDKGGEQGLGRVNGNIMQKKSPAIHNRGFNHSSNQLKY